jgi:diadenylate cyclase
VPFAERLNDLLARVRSYSPWEVVVEFVIIWLVVWVVVRFVQGTRAAGALKSLLAIVVVASLLVRVLGSGDAFGRIVYLYDRALALLAIALVVIFQPELRRALIRLGETSWFRASPTDIAFIAGEIAPACAFLSKTRFGALIVIERQIGLRALTEGGTVLNAELSGRLLQTIFYPGTALHDLAVLVRGKKIYAAGVQLPMADPSDMPDPTLGSRHRAAVGITKESDALVLVVSEETGQIRFAERGRLSRPYEQEDVETELAKRLGLSDLPVQADGEEAGTDDEPGTLAAVDAESDEDRASAVKESA